MNESMRFFFQPHLQEEWKRLKLLLPQEGGLSDT